MNDPVAHGSLELEVANFGPIVEANLDLRPLTVFVGPSNTGKSYLAILIYALHRFFGDGWEHSIFWDERTQKKPRIIEAVGEEAERLVLDGHQSSSSDAGVVLPSLITEGIRSKLDSQGDSLGREIFRCFGVDESRALIRGNRSRNEAHVAVRHRISDDPARFQYTLTLKPPKTELKTDISEKLRIPIDAENTGNMARVIKSERYRPEQKFDLLMNSLISIVLRRSVGPLHLPAYYLPADRTGVMHAHSVVVSALISSAPTAGLRPAARTPMLSGVLADFLDQLIVIDRPRFSRWHSPRRRRGHDLGTKIEEAVLGGAVRIDRSGVIDYPRVTYRPDGWANDLPLMNASSMVSELAPVVLYLRHLVGPGDLLIVEEPESHLHPAKQVEFTRQLAVLVQMGVRVLVTTHSEWLLEELANIVRRSELPEARRGHGAGGSIALSPDQVGAWLFEPKARPKGSVVKEIRLDDKKGENIN